MLYQLWSESKKHTRLSIYSFISPVWLNGEIHWFLNWKKISCFYSLRRWWKGHKCQNFITSSIVYGLYFGAVLDILIIWPHCTMGLIRPSQSLSKRILCHHPDFTSGQLYGFEFFFCWPPPGYFWSPPLSFPLWCPKQTSSSKVAGVFS